MHSSDGAEKRDDYSAKWKRVMAQMKFAYGKTGNRDEVKKGWLMWANSILEDLYFLRRRVTLPPPEEIENDWVSVRRQTERMRKPRTKLRPDELAVLIDVGDWLIQQRSAETENAATLECLLFAAFIFWWASGKNENASTSAIYRHIVQEWGVSPPRVEDVPKSKEARMRLCLRLMREPEQVPDWYFNAKPIPRELLADASGDERIQATEPPATSGLFGDVD